jgi:hypothetical protein
MPLDKVPGFLDGYAQALGKRGLGEVPQAGEIARAVGDAGEQAMQRTLDTVYPQHADAGAAASQRHARRDRRWRHSAQSREAAQDRRRLGLEVDTKARPEETIGRIRAAVERISPRGAIDTGNDVHVTPEHDQVHQAATSPMSDIPEPTDAQKAAGNYKVGRMRIAGLDVSIENPQGSVRRGTSADGKVWETPMRDHYGYIRGTVGADKDHLDVFVKPGTPEDYRGPGVRGRPGGPEDGEFDEHKVVIGAASADEAREQYLRNYDAGWQGLGAITKLPMPAFKAWAQSGKLKEPLGDIATTADRRAASPAAAPAPEPAGSRANWTLAAARASRPLTTASASAMSSLPKAASPSRQGRRSGQSARAEPAPARRARRGRLRARAEERGAAGRRREGRAPPGAAQHQREGHADPGARLHRGRGRPEPGHQGRHRHRHQRARGQPHALRGQGQGHDASRRLPNCCTSTTTCPRKARTTRIELIQRSLTHPQYNLEGWQRWPRPSSTRASRTTWPPSRSIEHDLVPLAEELEGHRGRRRSRPSSTTSCAR